MVQWSLSILATVFFLSGQQLIAQQRHLPITKEGLDKASEYYTEALQALDNQQLPLYLNKLSAAAEADSTFFMPSAMMAVYGYLLDSTHLLTAYGEEALQRDSAATLDSEQFIGSLVRLLLNEAEHTELSKAAMQLSEAYPECLEAHLLNGQLQFKIGKVTEALKAFFKVRELDQSYGPAYKYLAKTYLSVESYDKAGAYFEMYIVTTPEMADPHVCIGDFYSVIGWKDHALRHFQWALNIDPELSGVREKMATVDAGK